MGGKVDPLPTQCSSSEDGDAAPSRLSRKSAAQASADGLIRKLSARLLALQDEVENLRTQRDIMVTAHCESLTSREIAIVASHRLHLAACQQSQRDSHWAGEAMKHANWDNAENRAILELG